MHVSIRQITANKQIRIWCSLLALLALMSIARVTNAADIITITYWQPAPGAIQRDVAIDELIKGFESENPHIRVVHRYALSGNKYLNDISALLAAGEGPDVVTLINGNIPAWVNNGYLIPLPLDQFPEAQIEEQFFPIVQQSKYQGRYWALPTAVRTMALFYNPSLFDAAGIAYPDETWTIADMAEAATAIDGIAPRVVGFDLDPEGWGHHWLREVMVPLFGGNSYVEQPSDQPLQQIWGSPQACEALTWVLRLEGDPNTTIAERARDDGFPHPGFFFNNGLSAMHVDGPFRIVNMNNNNNQITNAADQIQFSVAPLPTGLDGSRRSFGSYWTHGLTPRVTQDKDRLEAAAAFLQHITSPEAGALWVEITGELPAQRAAISGTLREDPLLGPFADALSYAYATPFANETPQRNRLITAYNAIVSENVDPCVALDAAGDDIQELLDDFFENQQRWERGSLMETINLP